MCVSRTAFTLCLVFVLMCLGVPGTAHAGSVPAGTVEIAPTFAYAHTSANGASTTVVSGGGYVGYAVTSLIEPRLRIAIDHFDLGFGIAGTTNQMTAGATLNFPVSGSVVPFVDAGAGFVRFGDNSSAILPELGAGVRALIGNSTSLNIGVAYQRQTDQGTTEDVVLVTLGVSFFLNRAR